MYWPSCSADAEYVYHTGLATSPLASADMVLGTYADWKAISSWPQVPGAAPNLQVLATKQGDPESKKGIVGAFCRTYDVYSAMSTFLPGIYDPVDGDGVRFTYTEAALRVARWSTTMASSCTAITQLTRAAASW